MPKKKIFNNLSAKQDALRERNIAELQFNAEDSLREYISENVNSGKIKRPLNRCPVCFRVHFEDIPETCFKASIVSPVLLNEFQEYLFKNKKGRMI